MLCRFFDGFRPGFLLYHLTIAIDVGLDLKKLSNSPSGHPSHWLEDDFSALVVAVLCARALSILFHRPNAVLYNGLRVIQLSLLCII